MKLLLFVQSLYANVFFILEHTALHLTSNISRLLVRQSLILDGGGIEIRLDIRIEGNLWRKDIEKNMMRQCAWCLRLIDSRGERVSQLPLPKLYEASHGMCDICGMQWLQQMLEPSAAQDTPLCVRNDTDNTNEYVQIPAEYIERPSRTTTRLAHDLRKREYQAIDAFLHSI
jgi:hypothetical protein